MRKIMTGIFTVLACAVTAYAYWAYEAPDGIDDDHHHHHDHAHHDHDLAEAFIPFTKEHCDTHGIQISTATKGNLHRVARAPATITVDTTKIAHVLPRIPGIAVIAYKNLGEHVDEGTPLALIESKEMAEIKAAYLLAVNKYQLANNIFDRESKLYEKKISATESYHNAEKALNESILELELAKQRLYALGLTTQQIPQFYANQANNELLHYELRSPIPGQVIRKHIVPGEYIATDHEIYMIADLSHVWAEIAVFPQDRQYVKQGQNVTIKCLTGPTAEGKVVYLSPIVDEDTRTSTIIAEIDNSSGDWLPGTFAQAEIVTDVTEVPLLVPKESIQNIEGVDALFIHNGEGFRVHPVTIGKSDDKSCEITSGLSAGEAYASKNSFLLKADLQKDEAEHEH